MKTLDDTQTALVARSSISPVWLVTVIPWDDKGAGVLGEPLYFSNRAVWYNYDLGGAGNFFRPWIASVGELTTSMTHLASGAGSGISVRTLDLDLDNSEGDNERVAETIVGLRLEGAQVEVSELLLDDQTAAPLDLMTSHTGDEHTVKFRGTVTRVLANSSAVSLECESTLPRANWAGVIDADGSRPQDVGVRYPIPYGKSCIVPLVAVDVGWATSITAAIGDTYTGFVGVTDGSGFPPSGSFDVWIGSEQLTISGRSDQILVISARGVGGTGAQVHAAGMPVSEIKSGAKYVCSRYPANNAKRLFYHNLAENRLVQIPVAFTYSKQDGSVITDDSVSTVSFSTDQMLAIADFVTTQQASTTTPTSSDVDVSPTSGSLGANGWDGDEGTSVNYDNTDFVAENHSADVTFPAPGATATQTRIRIKVGALDDLIWLKLIKEHDDDGEVLIELDDTATLGWYEAITDVETVDYRIRWRIKSALSEARDFDFYEIEKVETRTTLPAETGTRLEIAAAQLSLDLQLYLEIDGVAAPFSSSEFAYGFESSANTADSPGFFGSTTSLPYYPTEGTFAWRMTNNVQGTNSTPDLDTIASDGWSAVSNVTYEPTERWVPNNDDNPCLVDVYDASGLGATLAGDWTDTGNGGIVLEIHFRIYLTDTGSWPDDANPMIVRLGSGDGTAYSEWHIGDGYITAWSGAQAADGINKPWAILIDPTSTPDDTSGTLDLADVQWLEVEWNSNGIANEALTMNNLQAAFFPKHFRTQFSSLGGVDWTSSGSEYQITAAGYGYAGYGMGVSHWDIEIYLSDTDEATVTIPTKNRKIEFDAGTSTVPRQLETLASTTITDSGGVDVTSVRSMQVRAIMNLGASGIFSERSEGNGTNMFFGISLDDFRRVTAAGTNEYEADTGDVLEYPVDIARHWITEVGVSSVDDTTFSDAFTNLGSNVLCGDARGWGSTWADVLDNIALISRANFVPEETASGTVWKMLTADATYGFGASVKTLTLFPADGVSIGGRDESLELASGRTTLYGYRAHLGNGDEAFTKVLRIGSDQNDSGGGVAAGDVTTALEEIGYVDGPTELILGIDDDTTMQDVASWRYLEGSRLALVVVISDLSWTDGYALEVGDIVSVTLPWEIAARKLRLIEINEDTETHRFEVRGVEVA